MLVRRTVYWAYFLRVAVILIPGLVMIVLGRLAWFFETLHDLVGKFIDRLVDLTPDVDVVLEVPNPNDDEHADVY